MNPSAYPLYVRARDLAVWLTRKEVASSPSSGTDLWPEIGRSGRRLVEAVALALSFPDRRSHHQRDADEILQRLRERLRLAAELGELPPGSRRFASEELDAIGRMLGGWRKRTRRRSAPAPRRGARAQVPGG